MSFFPSSKMENPDDYSFNGHIRLKNYGNLYLNLGNVKTWGGETTRERELLLEKKPVTIWHFQIRNPHSTIYIHSDGYSLDIYSKIHPRLKAWKSNWQDNQTFVWDVEHNLYIIKHYKSEKIGLDNLEKLVIDVIHPDCIPVEGYIKIHNPKHKGLYLNLNPKLNPEENKLRHLSITDNKEQRWKLKYLGFSDNSKNKYKVKITTEDDNFSLDILDSCRPELLAWRTNESPNQEFELEKMEKILLISRPKGKIGLDNYLELYIEFTD